MTHEFVLSALLKTVAALLCLIALTQISHAAEIYQCRDSAGTVTFSDQPCSPDAEKYQSKTPPSLQGNMSAKPNTDVANDSIARDLSLAELQQRIEQKRNEMIALSEEMNKTVNEIKFREIKQARKGQTHQAMARANKQIDNLTAGYDRRARILIIEMEALRNEYNRRATVK